MTIERRSTIATACSFSAAAAACLCLLTTTSLAAPPTATYFYPAGVQRGQTATITVGGSFSTWPVEVWSDRSDLKTECEKAKGKIVVTTPADAAPGVAWLRLHTSEGASSPRPLLIGTLPELYEDEPNDELAKANPASGATVVNGRLAKTDEVDCFAVTLRRGEQLVALLQAKHGLGSPMDGVLQIVNTDGFVLAQNDEGNGIDPLLVYSAPADGKYVVRLFAFPEVPTSSINFAGGENFVYRLTLSTAAIADAALPLALQAGQSATVRLEGWNLPAQLKELSVTAPAVGLMASVYHPELGNSITMPVTPHPSIVEQPTTDGQPQTVELPAVISGRIAQRGERDAYAFAAKKGEKFSIAVAGHELGFPIDPHLAVLDDDGKELAEDDDSGRQTRDVELNFTAPGDGRYRLQVRDLYGEGGPRHFYRITATKALPDYALSVSADSFVLQAGKSLEIPVTVSRKNGYSGEIEISVAGLPEGITAAAVKSAAKGDTSKSVKLVLKGEPEVSFAGLVRIVGVGTDDDKIQQTATASLAALDTVIQDLWLTAAAKK